jgi:TolB-like protein
VKTFKELKERRLVQIVVSYAVAGWVVMGIFSELIDREVLPGLLYRVLLVLYFGGLVASVIMGWFHGEKGHQKVTRTEVALLVLVAVATIAGSGLTIQRYQAAEARVAAGEAAGLELRRLAVLYFRDLSRGEDFSHVADGLTESLIDRLARSQTLDVVSQNGSARFRESSLPLDSISRILGAGALVDGTVERRGDRLRVNLSIIDGASAAQISRETLERPIDDIFALQDELADEVGALLGRMLEEEIDLRQARGGTESVAAWTLFQRGERNREGGEIAFQERDLQGLVRDFRAADSLYGEAERADPTWASPLTQRAALSIRWSQITAREDPLEAGGWINAGIQYADRALQLDGRDADAFRIRGTLGYIKWRLGLETNPREAEALYEQAREDLVQATQLDRRQAEAWNVLSVIYSEEPNLTEAKLAATRAYEADEFSQNAAEVLRRLYATSYDLEQYRDATLRCEEGRERFPDNPAFWECRLWLLSAPHPQAPDPDPEEAWAVLDEYLRRVPEPIREYEELKGKILVAGVLARAEQPDSAQAVLARSRSTRAVDPEMELYGYEAMVRLQNLGDRDGAMDLLKTYLTTNPEHRAGWQWTSHWWWMPLQEDPEFRALMAT